MPEFRPRREQIVVATLVVVGLLYFGSRLLNRPHAAAAPPIPTATTAAATHAQRMYVDVVGAVRRPGLYRLTSGSRVADAIARAGGVTHTAALDSVNIAAPVADGEQIVVPRRGQSAAVAAGPGTGATSTGPVHLSTATEEQLDSLPGIGPVTAQKILAFRQAHGGFSSVDELDAVPGIGPARLAQLKDLVAP
jgi:competence protein ComEA